MKDTISRQIAELRCLPYKELKERWAILYGGTPPAYNRDFIVNRLVYRIQELTYGGLSDRARRFLKDVLIANGFDENGCKPDSARKKSGDGPVLGTRFVREWNGKHYEATVVTGGFEYDGKRYRSLTAVATAITGTHWNGVKFFGLKAGQHRKTGDR